MFMRENVCVCVYALGMYVSVTVRVSKVPSDGARRSEAGNNSVGTSDLS